MAFVADLPDKTTLAAMKQAETSDSLETHDLDGFATLLAHYEYAQAHFPVQEES